MTYLVDANVLSEATKPAPDPKVVTQLFSVKSGSGLTECRRAAGGATP